MKTRRFLLWCTRGLSLLAISSFLFSGVLLAFTPKAVEASSCQKPGSECGTSADGKQCCDHLPCNLFNSSNEDPKKWVYKCGDCESGYTWNGSACELIDNCPGDADKLEAGICGCGIADLDSDNDGVMDCLDECPADAGKIAAGECGCGFADTDTDGDGTPDCSDTCDDTVDSDGDGVSDCIDGCVVDGLKTDPGICGCGTPDADSDGDGFANCLDTCDDLIDSDGDGVSDCVDECPADAGKTAAGECGCGVADEDLNLNGVLDCKQECEVGSLKAYPGICGCDTLDTDSDGDLTPDCNDECPLDEEKLAPGQCGCGEADTDTDGDGVADCLDACPLDSAYAELGEGWLVMEGSCYPEYDALALNDPQTCVPANGGGYQLMWVLNNPNSFSVPVTTGGTAVCSASAIGANGSIQCYSPDGPAAQSLTWSSAVGDGGSSSSLDCDPASPPPTEGGGGTPIIPVTAAGGPIQPMAIDDNLLIPVTGADAILNYALAQQLTFNLGFVFSGLAMVSGGLAKKSKEE